MSEESVDLTALSDDELTAHETSATEEFDQITGSDVIDAEGLARATELSDSIEGARVERSRRETAAAELAAQRDSLLSRIHGTEQEAPEEIASEATPAPEAVAAAGRPTGGATTRPATESARKLNVPLSEIAKRAPAIETQRREAVLVASADVPGFTLGGKLSGMEGLVAAMQARARVLSDGMGRHDFVPVASMTREFKYKLGPDATPQQISDVLTAASNPEALVAAGGWCAPSEISYDFFNIACEDGMLDLPTIGINRGGIRFPVSASFGDLVGNAAMFTWNETQDVAAATGTAQSGTKTCARVPCATFSEERLACDGICLTVGNLMDDAYPELIANHTKLLFVANAHKMNGLRINKLIAGSVAVSGFTGLGDTGAGVVAPLLGAIELQAVDYREKYSMCYDAVLEVVLPRWARSMMRSDLRRRTGIDVDNFADAYLMSLFDALNVRVQWIGDWQVRTGVYPGQATARQSWPSIIQFMLYAPGTYVLGNGLQLNLGVVRDSTLNATNDFTAEWMEECWLIAKMGHESRLVTVNVCADGTTGANDLTACGL